MSDAFQFKTPLKIKQRRPTRLSDPFHDFNETMLRELLATSDQSLEWIHFKRLLGPHLPAGTYQESVYFLPLAFDHLMRQKKFALDLVDPIFGFVSKNADQLANDQLLTAARARIVECLEHWTADFVVTHFDSEKCQAMGWKFCYFDLVQNCELVCETTNVLIQFARHADLAFNLFHKLAAFENDPIKAAWFLELSRAQSDVLFPPKHPTIRGLLNDRERIEAAILLVSETLVKTEPSPSYWNDTLQIV